MWVDRVCDLHRTNGAPLHRVIWLTTSDATEAASKVGPRTEPSQPPSAH